ncbi:MAG: YdcF family protein [Variibacter sp.]
MFFLASKLFDFVATPSNVLICCVVAGGVLLSTRFTRAGRRLVLVAGVLLLLFGVTPLSKLLILPLEQRFPPWDPAGKAPDGIIVLGGAVEPAFLDRGVHSLLNESAERVTAAVDLARRYPEARIVLSGGNASILPGGRHTEGDATAALLEALGVARARLIVEDRSRTTAENAIFSKAVAAAKPGERWLLVTSANHMPRAIGTFRKAGFPVEAFPVDMKTSGPDDLMRPFRTMSSGLKLTDTAMHEWIGLIGYWLAGRTSALFPGPLPEKP